MPNVTGMFNQLYCRIENIMNAREFFYKIRDNLNGCMNYTKQFLNQQFGEYDFLIEDDNKCMTWDERNNTPD